MNKTRCSKIVRISCTLFYMAPVVNFFASKQVKDQKSSRVARRVPHVEQELLTLPEHLSWYRVFAGFALLDLQFFVDRYLSFNLFLYFWPLCCMSLFDLRLGITIPLWYLQTFLNKTASMSMMVDILFPRTSSASSNEVHAFTKIS